MSNKIKIALAQFAVKRADVSYNIDQIQSFAEQAAELQVDLLCFPEMATTGFDWKYNAKRLPKAEDDLNRICNIARQWNVTICGSFLFGSETDRPSNALFFIDSSGEIIGRYDKVHLFTLFHEERFVEAGNQLQILETEFGKIGCSICYDIRFPELYRHSMLGGAILQLLPAAFPHPRLDHWQTLIRARAIENQMYLIATNQCGREAHSDKVGETKYFGHSMIVDPWGKVILEADESEQLCVAEIDLDLVQEVRSSLTATEDRRTDLY